MKKLLGLIIILSFCCPLYASNTAEIAGLTLSSSKGTVGSPVTITVTANGSGLNYRYWTNTVSFCQNPGAPNWVLLQDWTPGNTFTWTPTAAGFYTVVVWVTADTTAACCNLIGAGFTVEDIQAPITVDVNGAYNIHLIATINHAMNYTFDIPVTFTQTANTFSGSFSTAEGYSGTIQGTIVDNSTATFEIVFLTPCSGHFTGSATIENNGAVMNGNFTGSDCMGEYEATCTFTKQ